MLKELKELKGLIELVTDSDRAKHWSNLEIAPATVGGKPFILLELDTPEWVDYHAAMEMAKNRSEKASIQAAIAAAKAVTQPMVAFNEKISSDTEWTEESLSEALQQTMSTALSTLRSMTPPANDPLDELIIQRFSEDLRHAIKHSAVELPEGFPPVDRLKYEVYRASEEDDRMVVALSKNPLDCGCFAHTVMRMMETGIIPPQILDEIAGKIEKELGGVRMTLDNIPADLTDDERQELKHSIEEGFLIMDVGGIGAHQFVQIDTKFAGIGTSDLFGGMPDMGQFFAGRPFSDSDVEGVGDHRRPANAG